MTQIQLAQLLEATQAIGRGVGLPENPDLNRHVATQRRYVDACLRHHGYLDAIRQEFTASGSS